MQALWARLEGFELDAQDAAFDFSARLSRENRWSSAHTARVIGEYKRFLALAMCAGHPVTPSVAVDEAWHLHLLYTRSYWDDLCGTVLGRKLHHEPTTGGPEEAARFEAQYASTLASYRRLFGMEPPADIWPTSAPRVSQRWRPPRGVPLAVTLVTALTLVGCRLNVFDYRGTEFLAFYALGFLGSFVLSWLVVHLARRGAPTNVSEPLPSDPYELAMLGGGGERVRDAALAALHARGRLDVAVPTTGWPTIAAVDTGDPGALPAAEEALLAALPRHARKRIRDLEDAVRTPAEATHASLVTRGLLLSPSRHTQLRWLAAAPLLAMMAVACVKVLVGLHRERPVAFLVVLLALSAVALLFRVRSVSRRTPAGDATWTRLQQGQARLHAEPARPAEVATAVALGGVAALAGLPTFRELQRAVNLGHGGAAGCGSSNGGGGGDGGCGGGGCGGCGGGD